MVRDQVHLASGGNHQMLINSAPRECIDEHRAPLETTFRRVLLARITGRAGDGTNASTMTGSDAPEGESAGVTPVALVMPTL